MPESRLLTTILCAPRPPCLKEPQTASAGTLCGGRSRPDLHGSCWARWDGGWAMTVSARAPSLTAPTVHSFSSFRTQVWCPLLIPESLFRSTPARRSITLGWLKSFPVCILFSGIVCCVALISCSLSPVLRARSRLPLQGLELCPALSLGSTVPVG